MLRLESIVLQGFKSFVDRTRLTFPLGISCIVGPNGCGKSNIADAIAWVLGEQSPKSLRGEKMGDVIFAGSPTRAGSGHAEVAMTWLKDDGKGGHPERLEVGRKLFRNGDSDYILNSKSCRLKDVQSALLDFGMGTKTYSIIEQGKVGQILSSKPTERRQLLEEAAGILKYKIRRHESQLKLRSAEDNLQRLQDILQEIQKQRNYLKRQVGKARRYKLHKSRLREIEKDILNFEIFNFSEKLKALQSDYRQLNAKEQDASRQLNQLEDALKKKRILAVQRDEEHKQIMRDANETAKTIERLRQKIHFLKEKIVERNASLHAIHNEEIQSVEHKKNLEEDLFLCRKDLGHIEETMVQQKTELQHLQSTLEQERKELDYKKKQEEELRSELEGIRKRLHGLEIEHTQIIRQTSLLESQLAEYDHGKKERAEEKKKLSKNFDSNTLELTELEALISDVEKNRATLTERVVEKRKIKEQLTARTMLLQKTLHQIKNQYSNLQSLFSQRQDLSDTVRWVLKKTAGKIHLLRDYLDSSHQYDREAELLLGDLAQSFLITCDEDHRMLSPLRAKKSFSVLDIRFKPASPPAIEFPRRSTPLKDLLCISSHCSPSFKNNLENSLDTLVWNRALYLPASEEDPTIEELALGHPGLVLATPDETGTFQANLSRKTSQHGKSKGFLTLKGEIAELKKQEEQAKEQSRSGQIHLDQASTALQQAETQLAETRDKANGLLRDRDLLRNQVRHQQNLLDQIKKRQQREEHRVSELMASRKQIQSRTTSITEERSMLVKSITHLEHEWQEKNQIARQATHHVQENLKQEARLKEKTDAAAVLKTRIEEEHNQLKNMLKKLIHNENNRDQQVETFKKELLEFQSELAHLETDLSSNEKKMLVEDRKVSQMDKELGLHREHTDLEETHLGQLRDKRDDMRAKQGRYELEQARIQSELTHLKESYAVSQNEPYQAVQKENLLSDSEVRAQKTERADIKRKLSELGTVNLLAVEEFDEIEERYLFLITQQKDLVDAIAEIRSTIKTLNRESVARFKVAFEQINTLFQENFVALFGGGNARLELLDEEHVLDSGIDMIIQPPGKKLQNAMLMSGGEKALTATALLFSIFEYRPSPFCLLDEVDAPLDEANVMRLAKKLDQMKEQTQFIMITHHKSTMAIASSLFGVTMEENGCSKIVSVNFS